MNMKAKFQRFWTLSKNRKGFTLVELIVVIAILAILAGVAIPVYNGYIKKAQEAADQQLLDSINTAFAAACLSNGMDHTLAVGDLTINDDGTIAKTGARASATPVAAAEYWYFDAVVYLGDNVRDVVDPAFAMFYAGNEGAAFSEAFMEKNGKKLTVTGADDEDGGAKVKVTYNGKEVYVSQSAIAAFKNSVFNNNLPEMQNQVDTLAGFFGDFVGTKDNADIFGDDFVNFLKDYDDEDIGNAAVLYVAQNAANATPEDIANRFGKAGKVLAENPDATLLDALNAASEGGDPLTSAAVMYAAVVGFATSDACTDDAFKNSVKGVNSAGTLLDVFSSLPENQEWAAYVGNYKQDGSGEIEASEQFTNDVSGFLGAMDVLGTVSPDVSGAGDDFWSNDPEINKLLSELLGNN